MYHRPNQISPVRRADTPSFGGTAWRQLVGRLPTVPFLVGYQVRDYVMHGRGSYKAPIETDYCRFTVAFFVRVSPDLGIERNRQKEAA